jgi:hypothetical protein
MLKSTKDLFDASALSLMARVRTEMMRDPFGFKAEAIPAATKTSLWVLIVTLSSVAFSFIFACATPFAALGALASTQMKPRPGLALIVAAWATNQFIGFTFLSYPRSWDSFGWGVAIGVAALVATLAARRATEIVQYPIVSALFAFATAFAVYELVLFAATAILPSSAAAFSLPVVARILAINGAAFLGLLIIQRFGIWLGLQERSPSLESAFD